MDNHKWALLAWEQHRDGKQGQCYTLFHADYHWDGVDDFRDAPEAQEALSAATIGDLEQMTVSEDRIQYDSFIAPAVRRGLLDELHMYCLQDDGSDKGVDQDLCDAMGVKLVLHPDAESLAAVQPCSRTLRSYSTSASTSSSTGQRPTERGTHGRTRRSWAFWERWQPISPRPRS